MVLYEQDMQGYISRNLRDDMKLTLVIKAVYHGPIARPHSYPLKGMHLKSRKGNNIEIPKRYNKT